MVCNSMDKRREWTKDDICAVVVSFQPDARLIDDLSSLLPQVAACVVVDNGSSGSDVMDRVKALVDEGSKERASLDVIELGENRGIGAALNVGLSFCLDHGYGLLLTMDQDTVLAPDAVQALLETMYRHDSPSVGMNWDRQITADSEVRYLITSGNLVAADVAAAIGGYDEQLFIDSVDFDFSLRLSDHGYRMFKSAGALAEHRLGEKQGDSSYVTHSVDRYYYIYRNHFYLIRKHRKNHRVFCAKKQCALLLDMGKILCFDKDRKQKLQMLKKGYRDSRSFHLQEDN